MSKHILTHVYMVAWLIHGTAYTRWHVYMMSWLVHGMAFMVAYTVAYLWYGFYDDVAYSWYGFYGGMAYSQFDLYTVAYSWYGLYDDMACSWYGLHGGMATWYGLHAVAWLILWLIRWHGSFYGLYGGIAYSIRLVINCQRRIMCRIESVVYYETGHGSTETTVFHVTSPFPSCFLKHIKTTFF